MTPITVDDWVSASCNLAALVLGGLLGVAVTVRALGRLFSAARGVA